MVFAEVVLISPLLSWAEPLAVVKSENAYEFSVNSALTVTLPFGIVKELSETAIVVFPIFTEIEVKL